MATKVTRKVGDVHANGKLVWTEYQPGKFDWRQKKADSSDSAGSTATKTPSKPSSDQITAAKAKAGKPMNSQQLAVWATKTNETNLLKVANSEHGNAQMRKIAYDELERRGFDISQVDTKGTLADLLSMTSGPKKSGPSALQAAKSASSNDSDDDEGESKVTENWWLNKNDPRVKKQFNNLLSKQDRINYDKFLDNKKREQPDYESPVDVIHDLNEQYLEFLDNPEQRFMISAGGAGVGKSYGFEKLAEALNKKPFDPDTDKPGDGDYDYIEATDIDSKKKLLNLLKSHNGKIILFDDTDAVITRKDLASIMKKATSMTGKRIVGDPDDSSSNFEFTGRIVVMTNKDLATLSDNEDAKAILSRASQVSEIYMTVDETIELLEERFQKMNLPLAPRLDDADEDKQERQDLYDLIVKNRDNIDPNNFTTRTFGNILSTKRRIDRGSKYRQQGDLFTDLIGSKQKDWKKEALKTLIKAQEDEFEYLSEDEEINKAEDILLDETQQARRARAEETLFEKGECPEDDGVDYTVDEPEEEDDEVTKSEELLLGDIIEKARSGVYVDTAENRRLGRVGKQYGSKKEEEKKPMKISDLINSVSGAHKLKQVKDYYEAIERLDAAEKSKNRNIDFIRNLETELSTAAKKVREVLSDKIKKSEDVLFNSGPSRRSRAEDDGVIYDEEMSVEKAEDIILFGETTEIEKAEDDNELSEAMKLLGV